MESGFWEKLKTVITAFSAGATHSSAEEHGQPRSNSPSSGNFDTLYKSVIPLSLLRFNYRGERNCTHGFEDGAAMKIILFSIKFDKFTGFFDKILKRIRLVTDYNITNLLINLSAMHSNSATKKSFSAPPHLPANARISSRTASLRQTLAPHSRLTRNSPHLPA